MTNGDSSQVRRNKAHPTCNRDPGSVGMKWRCVGDGVEWGKTDVWHSQGGGGNQGNSDRTFSSLGGLDRDLDLDWDLDRMFPAPPLPEE